MQWLMITASFFLGIVYCQTVFGSPSQLKVTRTAVESLRDHGTYIIHFNDTITETELQNFTAILESKSKITKHFAAEIIEKFFIINCLTAKLSRKALQWVRICSYIATHTA